MSEGDMPRLHPAVDGAVSEISFRERQLRLYSAGSGSPLLLLHSVNAAASAYEVRPDLRASAAGQAGFRPRSAWFRRLVATVGTIIRSRSTTGAVIAAAHASARSHRRTAHRRARPVADLRVHRPRRSGQARSVPASGLRDADRLRERGARAPRGRCERAGRSRTRGGADFRPMAGGALQGPRQPAQHSLLPAPDLRLRFGRSGPDRLRLCQRPPARCGFRAAGLRLRQTLRPAMSGRFTRRCATRSGLPMAQRGPSPISARRGGWSSGRTGRAQRVRHRRLPAFFRRRRHSSRRSINSSPRPRARKRPPPRASRPTLRMVGGSS